MNMPQTRRQFLDRAGSTLGLAALAGLLHHDGLLAADTGGLTPRRSPGPQSQGGLPGLPHFKPRARHVIYLFQSGAPSQMDLFDYKPGLRDLRGTELPDSIRKGQRLTGMTSLQESFPVAPSKFAFARTANAAPG